jgi:aryl-phospho-beta-D-glucosidase BglC (GH1 family)
MKRLLTVLGIAFLTFVFQNCGISKFDVATDSLQLASESVFASSTYVCKDTRPTVGGSSMIELPSDGLSLSPQGTGTKEIPFSINSVNSLDQVQVVATLTPVAGLGQSATMAPLTATVDMNCAGKKGADLVLRLPVPELGLYTLKVELYSTSNASSLASIQTPFAAIPKRIGAAVRDMGVCTHLLRWGKHENVLQMIRNAGFSSIRDEMSWDSVEKTRGVYTFALEQDDWVNKAVAQGLSPHIVLDYGNKDVYPELFKTSDFPVNSASQDKFASYAQALVNRYKDRIRSWELWNEPQGFGKPTTAEYFSFVQNVGPKLKAVDPTATVISCGGSWAGGGPGGDCILDILKRGGVDLQDGWSIHPYMSPNNAPEIGYSAAGSPISAVNIPVVWPYNQGIIDTHPRSDGKKLVMWVTEIGWYTAPQSAINFTTPELYQEAFFVRTFLLGRRYGTAKKIFWYDFKDDGTDLNFYEDNFGLIHNNLAPKPAYVGAAVFAATIGEKLFASAPVDQSESKVYQYGSNGNHVIAGWTVTQTNSTVHIQPPAGRYLERSWDGRDKSLTITSSGLDWKISIMPRYLVYIGP